MTGVNRISTSPAPEVAAIEPRKQDELFDVSAVFAVLWSNVWLLLLPAVVFAGLGFYYVREVATPTFRATAQVVLQTSDAQIVNLQSVSGSLDQFDPQTIATELSVITSEQVLSKVVGELGLLEDPEFNPYLKVDLTELPADEIAVVQERELTDTIDTLRSSLEVRQLPGTYLFALTAHSADAIKTRNIANVLTDAYLEQQILQKVEATQQATEWLTQRAQQLQEQLLEAEARIENFRFAEAEGIQFADSVELERLTREAQAIRELYQHFLTRLKETAAQEGLHRADARILSYAVTPLEPSSPRTRFVLSLAAVAGFLLGVTMVVSREMVFRPGLRSPEALEAISKRPVLGLIPMLPRPQQHRLTNTLLHESNEAFSRAIEHLRLALLLRPSGGSGFALSSRYRAKYEEAAALNQEQTHLAVTIGVSSSTKDEGKTTTAIALAHSFATAGQRVLLVDADLRHRNLSQLLVPGAQQGLISVVLARGGAPRDRALVATELGFDFLPSEVSVERPVDFFQTVEFQGLMQEARRSYDYILIDTPPVLVVPDARALSPVIDQMIVVVRSGKTTQAMATESLAALEASGITIAGMVMTKVPVHVFKKSNHGLSVLAY